MFQLEGKTALATGGTRGIGQEMVLALAEAGADVILLQRNIDEDKTQKIVQNLGTQCNVVACDISNRDSIEKAMTLVMDQFKVDILLNAAGIMRRLPAENYDFQSYDTVMQTNLSAAFAICKTVGSYWLKNQIEGTIINVASLASFQGGINMAAYSASKGGLLQMSKALSNEWAGRGIRVNCVAPGYVETDMNVDTRTNPDTSYFDSITSRIPMGRWGRPEEFRGVAVFLASKASSYITGQCITVDGGWMAR